MVAWSRRKVMQCQSLSCADSLVTPDIHTCIKTAYSGTGCEGLMAWSIPSSMMARSLMFCWCAHPPCINAGRICQHDVLAVAAHQGGVVEAGVDEGHTAGGKARVRFAAAKVRVTLLFKGKGSARVTSTA
jgi:hypothetical protein